MGVIRKKNPKTGKWEVYGSTDAKDINLIDINNNYTEKNVESALREISTQINEQNQLLSEHSEDIEWLKEHGGSGGGPGGGGRCFLRRCGHRPHPWWLAWG